MSAPTGNIETGAPELPVWTKEDTLSYYGELNVYGGAICPPDYYALPHLPQGVESPKVIPWCSCGWTRHNGYELADHLRDMQPA